MGLDLDARLCALEVSTQVEKAIRYAQVVRFATFELDLQAGEVRKAGLKLKLSGQPSQVLAILLEHAGARRNRDPRGITEAALA